MNVQQLVGQIRHRLQTLRWPTGGQGLVFGADNVRAYTGVVSQKAIPSAMPIALVVPGSDTSDDEEPALVTQQIDVALGADVTGDRLGEFAVLGGPRPDIGESDGASILELRGAVADLLRSMTGADGAPIVVSQSSGAAPFLQDDRRQQVFCTVSVSAVCTTFPTYAAPRNATLEGGILRWDPSLCAGRYDFWRFVAGYVAGSSPVASADDLDVVDYSGPNRECAVSFAPGRTFQVFAQYDGRATGTRREGESDALPGTYVTPT